MSSNGASVIPINSGPAVEVALDVHSRRGNEGTLGLAPILVECGRFRKMVLPSYSYDTGRVNCVLCNSEFGRRRELTRHLHRVHFGWEVLHFRAVDAEIRFEALAQSFSDQLEKRVSERVHNLEAQVAHLRASFYKRFVEALETAGVALVGKAAFASPEGGGLDSLERAKLAILDSESQSRSFVRSVAYAQDLEEKLVVANAALKQEKARVDELERENRRLAFYESECFSWRLQQKYQHQGWLQQQQEKECRRQQEEEERRRQQEQFNNVRQEEVSQQPVQLQAPIGNTVGNTCQEEVSQQFPCSYRWSNQQPHGGAVQHHQWGWQQAQQQQYQQWNGDQQNYNWGYGSGTPGGAGSYHANSSFSYQ